jgi:hypothetical protein
VFRGLHRNVSTRKQIMKMECGNGEFRPTTKS